MPRGTAAIAKLTRPRLAGAVARQRLFQLLDDKRETHAAVWVIGPPGSGKTALVTSWLDDGGIKGIWYQVDPGDADLPTFFHYLRLAVSPFSRKNQPLPPALTPEYLSDVAGFARRFFRELFARLPAPSTLALDNYQEVDAAHEFHRIVAAAVNEVPPGVTLLVISRRDPPDCYARLITNEKVAFVDWDALKLTLDEAQAIARKRCEAESAMIGTLHEQSMGWAAGFTLMLDRLGRGAAVPDIVTPESLREVFDYFAGELFERSTPHTHRLLLALSFLPRMSEAAAEAVTGTPAALRVLEDFHRRCLFTDRRRAGQPIYQFHALFLAFLRDRAARLLDHGESAEYKRRAAEALVRDGDVDGALPLYMDIGEVGAARAIILANAADLIRQGRWQVVAQWIEALPGDVVASDCWLLHWLGTARIFTAPLEARAQLERSYARAMETQDTVCALQAAAGVVQSYMLAYTHFRPLDRWTDVIYEGLQRGVEFPSVDAEVRVQSALLVCLSYRRPDDVRIDACAARVHELLPGVADVNLRVMATAYLLAWASTTGPIEVAARVVPLLRSIVREPGVTALNAAWSWFLISWYHCSMTHRRECCEAVSVVEHIAEAEGLPMVRKFAALIGSWLEMHAGNIEAAQKFSERLDELIDPSRLYDRASSESIKAWLAVLRCEPRAALVHGQKAIDFFDQSGSIHHQTTNRFSGIWAQILSGDLEDARRRISDMRQFASRLRSLWNEILLRATEAWIALECGDQAVAAERLRAAFGMSRERGQDHAWGHHMRPWMPDLCAAALRAGIEVEYVRKLIRRFGWPPPVDRPERWPWAVSIYTLGHFQLLIDGQPPPYSRKAPKKPLALLKALVAFGGQRVSEQRLIDALWPDEEGDRGHQSLAAALQRLRRLLKAPEAVVVSEGALFIDRTLVWTDVEAFEEAMAEGQESAAVRRALPLYRGEFLAEDAEAPWTVSARERLRGKFVRRIETAGCVLEQESRWAEATALYLRGLDADPLAEAFYQGLMRCHLANGRRAEGLSIFRRMRQTLSVTLGVRPSAESERLSRELMEGYSN